MTWSIGHTKGSGCDDDAIGTAKLRLQKVLEQPEACFGGWLPLSAKLGGEPDSSLGEIRVEVRLLYGEEAGHVKEHHLGREMSKDRASYINPYMTTTRGAPGEVPSGWGGSEGVQIVLVST